MRLLPRRETIPEVLRERLTPDERLLAVANTVDGELLAATRFGLWRVGGDAAQRWDWHVVSKARLADRVLTLTVADAVDRWPDGTVALRDRPPVTLRPAQPTRLTDIVHHRVRRSVVASRYLPWPGAGGWVVVRRVPGRDGVTPQVRLDPGADPSAEGFVAAVMRVVDALWPEHAVGLTDDRTPM